jgi:hypothetical protein
MKYHAFEMCSAVSGDGCGINPRYRGDNSYKGLTLTPRVRKFRAAVDTAFDEIDAFAGNYEWLLNGTRLMLNDTGWKLADHVYVFSGFDKNGTHGLGMAFRRDQMTREEGAEKTVLSGIDYFALCVLAKGKVLKPVENFEERMRKIFDDPDFIKPELSDGGFRHAGCVISPSLLSGDADSLIINPFQQRPTDQRGK